MTSIISLSAAELSEKLASREVSSEEATKAHLERIEAVEGSINAFLHVNDEALAAAKQIDERRAAGEQLHELAGVPIAIKDVLTTKGMPST
ncbi:amidase family protein, partial [Agrococcus casei]